MLNEPAKSVSPTPERRTALWPYVVMPLAALVAFFALHSARHSSETGIQTGTSTDLSRSSGE
jgi:hypothetical protein